MYFRTAKSLFVVLVMTAALFLFSTTLHAAETVTLSGTVTSDGAAVNAMVLAGGDYAFSAAGDGSYSLESVYVDDQGMVTLYCFCAGRAPYKETFTPISGAETRDIALSSPAGNESSLTVTHSESKTDETYTITGTVKIGSTPVTAMVLANGEYTFSSAQDGSYSISDVPLDSNNQVTIQCFCEGALPYDQSFQPFTGEIYTNSIGQTFVLIPAGTFTMGSPASEEGHESSEGPQHTVTITQPFYMMTTEVTQGQYEAIMKCDPSHYDELEDDHPVECTTWYDARDFATELNALENTSAYRLPTEAEWEYACRAGTTTVRYWGDSINSSKANYGLNVNKTTPVGYYQPNPWGLYDMLGNVWEWCQDWYISDYYESSPRQDPLCDNDDSKRRTIRGGSYFSSSSSVRSANRGSDTPGNGYNYTGFRLVRSYMK